jgi:hypothetical protein
MLLLVTFAAAALTVPLRAGAAASSQPAANPAAKPAVRAAVKRIDKLLVRNNDIVLQQQRNMLESMKTSMRSTPSKITLKPEDLITASLDSQGLLDIDTSHLLTLDNMTHFKVEGSDADWRLNVMRQRQIGVRAPVQYIQLQRYDFDQKEEGEFWQIILTVTDNYLYINMQGIGRTVYYQQMLNQNAVQVHLMVIEQRANRFQQLVQASAPSLAQLREQHPEEVRKYLGLMFTRLFGRNMLLPGATDVYSVFDQLPADPSSMQSVQRIIPQLAADDPSDREAASLNLAKLGAPGVLAVLRCGDSNLTAEQQGRLGAFLASERSWLPKPPEQMRSDPGFLLDAMEYPDQAVRAAAVAALQKIVAHPIDFDVTLAPSKTQVQLDKLRVQVHAELLKRDGAVPQTQPADVKSPIRSAPAAANAPAIIRAIPLIHPHPHPAP